MGLVCPGALNAGESKSFSSPGLLPTRCFDQAKFK